MEYEEYSRGGPGTGPRDRGRPPEDETAIQMADESVTWGEFCGMLSATGRDIESYFDQMATYYGVAADWDGSIGDGSGQSYAQYAVSETREYLESLLAIRGYAGEQGVALDEEQVKSLEPEELARLVLGEDASVGEFYAALDEEAHMSFETYRAMREANLLYTKLIDTLYGPAGEKVSEEDAVAWLEEQDYLAAGHILLMTIDPNTGDARARRGDRRGAAGHRGSGGAAQALYGAQGGRVRGYRQDGLPRGLYLPARHDGAGV